MPDRPFTEEQTTSFGCRLHPQIESRHYEQNQVLACKLRRLSARGCGLGWLVRVEFWGWDGCESHHCLLADILRKTGFEGEDTRGGSRWHFRFQGSVSRGCDGCRVRRRRAACSERLLHKERRKSLNLSMLFFCLLYWVQSTSMRMFLIYR